MTLRFLHIHSSFDPGGKEARAVRLMNAFGAYARHSVISAVPDALSARAAIAPGIEVDFPTDHPALTGLPGLRRYRDLARFMQGFDLLLTYNWGAMDAVAARRLFAKRMALPPLVHHEDGFNADEANRQKAARIWFRRFCLPAAYALVVPSQTLEQIALTSWHQPATRIRRIANGIALDRYVPRNRARGPELVVGTIAGLRAVKNLPMLVRAFAASGVPGRLRIIGEGPERATILSSADERGIGNRLDLAGFDPDPASALAKFDIFALSSDSEQQPISLIEAMASSLPVVATDVGDVRAIVSEENAPFIVPAKAEDRFAAALAGLARNHNLRCEIGTANRAKALQFFGETLMIDRYRRLYTDALGQSGALGQA